MKSILNSAQLRADQIKENGMSKIVIETNEILRERIKQAVVAAQS